MGPADDGYQANEVIIANWPSEIAGTSKSKHFFFSFPFFFFQFLALESQAISQIAIFHKSIESEDKKQFDWRICWVMVGRGWWMRRDRSRMGWKIGEESSR